MSRTSSWGILALTLIAPSMAAIGEAVSLPDDETVRISGTITAGEDPMLLAGARVDALEEGLFPRGGTWTDEKGVYTFEVPLGIYDLRVLPPTTRFVAEFARDLDLDGETIVVTGGSAGLGIETIRVLSMHGAKGMALGHSIYLETAQASRRSLIAHELAHVAQYERLGGRWVFLRDYLRQCLSDGYWNAPLEIEARKKAEELGAGSNEQ